MKRAFVAAGLLVLLASMVIAGGRGNVVRHYYDDGTYKEFLASQGNCRHHLSAHPLDTLATVDGYVQGLGPGACN